MAPKSVTFRRHDHLVSVLFGDLLSHSYNITFSMFLYLVNYSVNIFCPTAKLHEECINKDSDLARSNQSVGSENYCSI